MIGKAGRAFLEVDVICFVGFSDSAKIGGLDRVDWAVAGAGIWIASVAQQRGKMGHAVLVARPEDWKWSSVRAHLAGVDDARVAVRPVLDRIPHLKALLLRGNAEDDFSELRRAELTGRPLGAPEFVAGLESLLGRKIARRPPAANRKH